MPFDAILSLHYHRRLKYKKSQRGEHFENQTEREGDGFKKNFLGSTTRSNAAILRKRKFKAEFRLQTARTVDNYVIY